MKLDGATVFDPMGNGRVMADTVLMPEETFGDDAELKSWLSRALAHAVTLPVKEAKPANSPAKAKPVAKSVAKKAASKPATKKPAAKKSIKPAAKKPAAKPKKR